MGRLPAVLASLLCGLATQACVSSRPSRSPDARPPSSSGAANADAAGVASVEGSSTEPPIQLRRALHEGQTTALYVPVLRDGRAELFHLDTASYVTVLLVPSATGWVEHAGTVVLGKRDLSLPGIGGLGSIADLDGRSVTGMAGFDLFLGAPTLLDVEAGLLSWPGGHGGADLGIALDHEIVGGVALVSARFDGVDVRLVLDTGAAHSLWVGVQPSPGDVPITVEDALGQSVTVYQCSVQLALADTLGAVTLLRAPTFPIVEELQQRLGVRVDGLLGLSAFRALYVDRGEGELRVLRR